MIPTRPKLALAAIGLIATGVLAGTVVAQSSDPPTVKRVALAGTDAVKGAPGRSLGLSKVVIPPGGTISLHRHRGTQAAYIDSGTLTYTVSDGEVRVLSGPPDESPKIVRVISAGKTGKIRAGEWIVEQPNDIHRAANRGGSKIRIYLATLLKTGAPPSTPVD